MEKIVMWISWHLPRTIAYWCAIRVATYNYMGSPDDRTVSQMLKAWDKKD